MLRLLLRNWLQSVAAEKLRDKAVDAAEEHVRQTAEEARNAMEIRPCEVGMVFAMGIESGHFEDLLESKATIRGDELLVRQGTLHGRNITLVRSGVGRAKAAAATEALIDGHEPQWILSAGFAGGLQSGLERNDIVMIDHVVGPDGAKLAIDLRVDPESLASIPHVHAGSLLTVDEIIHLPDEKRSLGEKHAAMAVDMETFAVAEVCQRRKVRFLAVRVISDTVEEEVPKDVENLLSQKTTPGKLGAAAGALWRRPSAAKDMLRLRENALAAAERLAKFLDSMIQQL